MASEGGSPVRWVARVMAVTAMALSAALGIGPSAAAGNVASPALRDPLPPTDPSAAVAPGLYLVTLAAPPAGAYTGGLPGYPATTPDAGKRFDRRQPAVRRYQELLRRRQGALLRRIGAPEDLVYHYTTAVNGFAAWLDTYQVKRLRSLERVVNVERNVRSKVDKVDKVDMVEMAASQALFNLSGAAGAWARYGGADDAGKDVVVGVVDSGIWPENPSFAGASTTVVERAEQLPGFSAACRSGEQWTRQDCDDKVVTARWFVAGFGASAVAASDYLSPRDSTGHGSHVAATAAGDTGVVVTIDGERFGRTAGVAPAARLAVYKACWTAPDPQHDGCATADTVKAVDRAVADGVDILNYSVGGSRSDLGDTVQTAFRNAATAGVFVAASAGNTGPADQTVGHPSPWVTTVAATTYQRWQGGVRLGDTADEAPLVGAMVSAEKVRSAPLVVAKGRGRLCRPGSLEGSAVIGAIVVCDRGVIPRVDKSAAVRRAGGVGMVLVNTTSENLEADVHAVPTVHLDEAAGQAVKAYAAAAGANATAALDPSARAATTLPLVAGFSSRGPSQAAGGSLLKPDVAAPGVGVVAAVAPPGNSGRLWDVRSGSSTAAAHVAGLAAFVRAEHPSWSPARVKSALMTTSRPVPRGGPLAVGAGGVDARRLLDPGLVYDHEAPDWTDLLNHTSPPHNLNQASIAVGAMPGRTTVRRSVTNVTGRRETYTLAIDGLRGIDVAVQPVTLTVPPGASREFHVHLTATSDALLGRYATGALTWRGSNGHDVRSPVVVRPISALGPPAVHARHADGSTKITAEAGLTGDLELRVTGLAGTTPQQLNLPPGQMNPAAPTDRSSTFVDSYTVAADTQLLRIELDASPGDDLDLHLYRGDELVAVSADHSASEQITLRRPPPGVYTAYVNAHSAADRTMAAGELTGWVVGPGDADRLTVVPTSVEVVGSRPFRFTVAWGDSLEPAQRWLALIGYGDTATGPATLITID